MNRLIAFACECATPVVDVGPIVDGYQSGIIAQLIALLILILSGA